eukprot:3830990-Pyramimonas_sp.AAC.1
MRGQMRAPMILQAPPRQSSSKIMRPWQTRAFHGRKTAWLHPLAQLLQQRGVRQADIQSTVRLERGRVILGYLQ